jgi:uncharacterized membrane protein
VVATGSSLERTNAFSDAVFAIAMTILVLELHVPKVAPEALPQALLGLVPGYLTFALSFVVVGMIWLSHHRKFSVIDRFDQNLLRLNLLVLLLVASLALPTALLGEYGDQTISTVVYATLIGAIGFLMSGLWIYAWRRRLVNRHVDGPMFRLVLAQSLIIPGFFVISIPVGLLAGPAAAEITWALAIPASVLFRHVRGRSGGAPERNRP